MYGRAQSMRVRKGIFYVWTTIMQKGECRHVSPLLAQAPQRNSIPMINSCGEVCLIDATAKAVTKARWHLAATQAPSMFCKKIRPKHVDVRGDMQGEPMLHCAIHGIVFYNGSVDNPCLLPCQSLRCTCACCATQWSFAKAGTYFFS